MSKILPILIEQLVAKRKAMGLTQRDLSDITRISQPSIARFESGSVPNPTILFINRIAFPLGLKLDVKTKGEN